MRDEAMRVNRFVADAIERYPSGAGKTEYQKVVEGATEEEKVLATKIITEQGIQAKVDCYIK